MGAHVVVERVRDVLIEYVDSPSFFVHRSPGDISDGWAVTSATAGPAALTRPNGRPKTFPVFAPINVSPQRTARSNGSSRLFCSDGLPTNCSTTSIACPGRRGRSRGVSRELNRREQKPAEAQAGAVWQRLQPMSPTSS